MEDLLISNSESGEHPNQPLQNANDVRMLSVAEVQPWEVTASDEDINHRTVTTVQHILQQQVLVAIKHAMKRGADAEQK